MELLQSYEQRSAHLRKERCYLVNEKLCSKSKMRCGTPCLYLHEKACVFTVNIYIV